jgi:hypothetical protein
LFEQEEKKAKPNEKLLGSSEIIESVFGKLKRIEGDQEKSGFTGNLLIKCMRHGITNNTRNDKKCNGNNNNTLFE